MTHTLLSQLSFDPFDMRFVIRYIVMWFDLTIFIDMSSIIVLDAFNGLYLMFFFFFY